MKSTTIDWFTLHHILLWLIVGFFYPNNYYLVLFLGILWELFVKTYWPVPKNYWNFTF